MKIYLLKLSLKKKSPYQMKRYMRSLLLRVDCSLNRVKCKMNNPQWNNINKPFHTPILTGSQLFFILASILYSL